MQAAVVPAVSSSWQIKDVPQPQPGPNQVLVKMHASGICYTDVHLTLGHFPGLFPRILGHEPVGEIVAVAVRFKSGMSETSERLALWCRERIRRAAVPERWYFVSELPRTPRGKTRRNEVYLALAGKR